MGVPRGAGGRPAGDVWVVGDDGLGVWSAGEWRWVAAPPEGGPLHYDLAVLADGILLCARRNLLYTFDGADWTLLATLNDGDAGFDLARDAVYVHVNYGPDVARVRSDGSLEVLDTDSYTTGPVWREGDLVYTKFYETLMETPAAGDLGDGSRWQPSSLDPGFYLYVAHGIGDAVWLFGLDGTAASVRDGRVSPEEGVGAAPQVWAERDEVFASAGSVLSWQHGGTGWTPLGASAPMRLRGNGRGDVYGLTVDGEVIRVLR